MIQENPTNTELIKAYVGLISKVSDIEMKYLEQNMDYSKSYDKNHVELAETIHTAQADVIKKQIETGSLAVCRPIDQL